MMWIWSSSAEQLGKRPLGMCGAAQTRQSRPYFRTGADAGDDPEPEDADQLAQGPRRRHRQ
jgi:hypothetical protein